MFGNGPRPLEPTDLGSDGCRFLACLMPFECLDAGSAQLRQVGFPNLSRKHFQRTSETLHHLSQASSRRSWRQALFVLSLVAQPNSAPPPLPPSSPCRRPDPP